MAEYPDVRVAPGRLSSLPHCDKALVYLYRISRRWYMPRQTGLTKCLSITQPIIQAPLGGGGDTPALVAAVCEAGALGFIGAAYLTPPQIVEAAQAVRARTARPFVINLFPPVPAPAGEQDPAAALQRLAPFYAELGLPLPALSTSGDASFDE